MKKVIRSASDRTEAWSEFLLNKERVRFDIVNDCYLDVLDNISAHYTDDEPIRKSEIIRDYQSIAAEDESWSEFTLDEDFYNEWDRIWNIIESRGRDEAAAWS